MGIFSDLGLQVNENKSVIMGSNITEESNICRHCLRQNENKDGYAIWGLNYRILIIGWKIM